MALNFSPCSVFPAYSDSEFVAEMRQMSHWFNREGECNGGIDPVDLLPSDPFGMDLSNTTAAIAGWMEDLGADPDDLEVPGLEYFVDQSLWFYSECDRVDSDCSDAESFSELSGYEVEDEERFASILDLQVLLADSNAAGVAGGSTGGGSREEESVPHDALLLSLGYLGVRDLLLVEGVCRSLRSAVQDDPLLWRCIHIDSPLSERITDDALLRLTHRAQGSLQCLSLAGCSRITDDGLRHVLDSNPKLTKLSIPGCLRLTIDGLINNLKALKFRDLLGIKHLRLGRFFNVTEEHFEELKLLLGVNQFQLLKARKPQFYHSRLPSPCCDIESIIDIEMCPGCQKLTRVYDCPTESCQEGGREQCRACEVCISRCVQCGRCIKDCKYLETFCLQYLCSECWKNPPESTEGLDEEGVVFNAHILSI